jgi:hypothetical protein
MGFHPLRDSLSKAFLPPNISLQKLRDSYNRKGFKLDKVGGTGVPPVFSSPQTLKEKKKAGKSGLSPALPAPSAGSEGGVG